MHSVDNIYATLCTCITDMVSRYRGTIPDQNPKISAHGQMQGRAKGFNMV